MSTQTVVSKDGTVIAYDSYGSGPALILVGGAFQHRAFDPRTAEIATELSDTFTVYHYDRRGRGESTDTAPYATEREIDDIAALIERAGGAAAVFGHSSGAVLSLDAVAAGLPISRLAVYEAPMIVDATRSIPGPDYRTRLSTLIGQGRRGDAVELFLAEGVGVPAEFVTQMRQAPMWPGFEAVAHTLPYDAAIEEGLLSGAPAAAERWPSIGIPVLVMDGGASPEWMRNAASSLARALPTSSRITLPGQDHGPTVEAMAPPLRNFFGNA
jgi:pimeloyl-ACP methyl ester carboxylesterase